MKITDITETVKDIVSGYVHEGDRVVDATLGNGSDSLWLSQLIGYTGKIYCFEINNTAAGKAMDMLFEKDAPAAIEFIYRGHERMAESIHEEVAAVVFNLGYLPGGDTSITTKKDTTLKGVRDALRILRKGGILTIACYRGHDEGREEDKALDEWSRGLDKEKFHAVRMEMVNQGDGSPVLYAVVKKG